MMLASSNALKSSAMYIGYLILKEIKKQEAGKISIYDVSKALKKAGITSSRQLILGLSFLYSVNIVEFMGKEISRIRLNRLYSESNIFEEISFHDGVNIILGEKYDDSSVKGRKTNGVGKSMSIEFLDFGFLNDYEKSRIAKIPKEVFPLEENVILDLDIGDEAITIKRNRKQADQPVIIREGRTVSFDKLQDAREYLTGLIFKN